MKNYTRKDFETTFPNDDACLDWLMNHRYPQGVECPVCQKVTKHHKLTNRPVYECDYCGHQISPLANTIFHKSSTSLKIWFQAIHLMASTRCGISAKQLQRETGVTYKTAWRVFKQIRTLLNEQCGMLTGEVEADETYIGASKHGKRGRGASGKTIVAGVVERQASVSASVVPNVQSKTLLPMIIEKTSPNAIIFTDEMPSYNRLERMGFNHRVINHNARQYVNGNIHTNTIDGFWSLVKGGIGGVYKHVSPDYLQEYVNEYSFRYNHRKDEQPMFETFLNRIQPHA
jgi:transposase-like protein/Zn ribbon nucleic-acid-binding protein